jgi:hypothetical protein
MATHPSDSSVQQAAEKEILAFASAKLGVPIESHWVDIEPRIRLQVDGFNESAKVLCEACAHIGKLKPAQERKIEGDVLKMLFIEKRLPGLWKKYLLFADAVAAAKYSGANSWLAKCCREFNIEIMVATLSDGTRAHILAAQKRQHMGNTQA